MAELSTIARPYAHALFDVARADRQGDLNAWAGLVSALAAVAANPDMQVLLNDPRLTDEQLYDLFAAAVKTPLQPAAQNFLRTLIENDRVQALPEVARQFHALKNEQEGTADAEIVSAFPLTDAQVAELVAGLEKKFKVKLKPHVAVDQSLIGGVRVAVGDQVLDTSVRAQLERMRHTLTA